MTNPKPDTITCEACGAPAVATSGTNARFDERWYCEDHLPKAPTREATVHAAAYVDAPIQNGKITAVLAQFPLMATIRFIPDRDRTGVQIHAEWTVPQ